MRGAGRAAVPRPGAVGRSTSNLLVPLYVVIGAGAVAWIVPRLGARRQGERPAERSGALEWVLLGGIVLYALQSVYAEDSAKAFEQVVFFYVPFALLFALLRGLPWTPRHAGVGRRRARRASRSCSPAIGFWEFQTRHLLLNPKVIASNQVEEYFRVNSLFFDPNIYGRFLALVMIGLGVGADLGEAAAVAVLDDRGARRALGRADHDALAVELRRAAARPGRAGVAALGRQGRRAAGARGRGRAAAVLVLRLPGRAAARPRRLRSRSTRPPRAAST